MIKTGIILLAAGAGKRFGGNKLEAVVQGKPMYRYALDAIRCQTSIIQAVVVTSNPTIAAEAAIEHMEVVHNPFPELGISRSIHMGMERLLELCPEIEAVMFMVCDQPWLRSETLNRMITNFDYGIMALEYNGQHGNPAIFSRKYFHELMQLTGDVGGRQVMEKHKEAVYYLKVFDEKELRDIDRREELE